MPRSDVSIRGCTGYRLPSRVVAQEGVGDLRLRVEQLKVLVEAVLVCWFRCRSMTEGLRKPCLIRGERRVGRRRNGYW